VKGYAICDIYSTQDIRGVFTATEYQNEDSLFLRKNVPIELKDIGSKVQYNDLPNDSDLDLEAFENPNKTFVRRIVYLPHMHHHDVEDSEDEGQWYKSHDIASIIIKIIIIIILDIKLCNDASF
jgi:hypothetical protein